MQFCLFLLAVSYQGEHFPSILTYEGVPFVYVMAVLPRKNSQAIISCIATSSQPCISREWQVRRFNNINWFNIMCKWSARMSYCPAMFAIESHPAVYVCRLTGGFTNQCETGVYFSGYANCWAGAISTFWLGGLGHSVRVRGLAGVK